MKEIPERITVGLDERSYPILIGAEILDSLGTELLSVGFPRRVAVVTNQEIADLYAGRVADGLKSAGFAFELVLIPEGEAQKNLQTLETIYDALIGLGFDRSCGLIALGGGVVGDTVGFAAATFLRGIPFAQVPTTLLAQVDSSVGGKTAVNHPLGKNLIGAFYQPKLVLIDVATLDTLAPRELSTGLAEVVKYGVIRDRQFFAWLEEQAEQLLQRDRQALVKAVKRSCQIKADIVEVDEKEGSVRAILNYGHTFGHAIEALAGYGEWRHGEAVAVGMLIAARIASSFGLCNKEEIERLESLLKRLGLPVEPPAFPLADYVAAMQRDKKVREGTLTLVLNRGLGDTLLQKVPDVASVFSQVLKS